MKKNWLKVIIIKILVALNNKKIKEKLDLRYKDKVYNYDFVYKEDIISYIEKYNNNYIILTRLDLSGNMNYLEYIRKIKKINTKNRIIIIIDKLEKEIKEFLFANEVFNIIEGNEIDMEVIYKQINTENKIVYKTVYKKSNNSDDKRKITVFGSNGSGKSFISSLMANSIAKKTKKRVVLVSFDDKNSCLDIINNINCFNFDIKHFFTGEDMNYDYISKSISQSNVCKNLWLINSDIKLTDNRLKISKSQMQNLTFYLESRFDYVIFDLPNYTLNSNYKILMDIVDEIIFVTSPNYISIKQSKIYLDFIYNKLKIPKDKLKLIINKNGVYSLDIRQIKSILNYENKFVCIKYIRTLEAYINGILYENPLGYKTEEKVFNFLSIKEEKITNSK